MRWSNLFTPCQIRNRPRDLEHAMERPRAQLELLHGRAHQRLPRRIELAEDSHIGRRHVGVAHDSAVVRRKAFALSLPRRLNTRGDDRRWLAQSLARELFVGHARHFNVDVNAKRVEQGAADTLLEVDSVL